MKWRASYVNLIPNPDPDPDPNLGLLPILTQEDLKWTLGTLWKDIVQNHGDLSFNNHVQALSYFLLYYWN